MTKSLETIAPKPTLTPATPSTETTEPRTDSAWSNPEFPGAIARDIRGARPSEPDGQTGLTPDNIPPPRTQE